VDTCTPCPWDQSHGHSHRHAHGVPDPAIVATGRGLWALKWSFIGLLMTAALQLVVVVLSGSVALLADTIHNFADAATAIPLGIAFWLGRRRASRRFTYGLGRLEDFAGLVIVGTILASAIGAAYESVRRLMYPQPVELLWAVMLASIIGFAGNEAVAIFRIRVGRQIGSAALVADGYHARVDGWTSLAVLLGAIGVWAGYPLADPVVGLLISAAIFMLVWQAARSVLVRMMDGVEPGVLDEIIHTARHAHGVEEVTDVRARVGSATASTWNSASRWPREPPLPTLTRSREKCDTSFCTTCLSSGVSRSTWTRPARGASRTTESARTRTTACRRIHTTEPRRQEGGRVGSCPRGASLLWPWWASWLRQSSPPSCCWRRATKSWPSALYW
jgi:cation diffusion facilitator family transporter